MASDKLRETAKEMVSRTILAADESTGTIKKRFATIGVESTPETNREYRQLLFAAPGIEEFVSGVILYDETLRQADDSGKPFAEFLSEKGILPGIKVDQGTEKIPDQGEDTYTKGLDGLAERFDEYRTLGARFAKWRAVYTISEGHPSDEAIARNAADLAQYALISQESEIVPIVEPEVLMDGGHSIDEDKEVTEKVLTAVFKELKNKGVDLQGIVLKPNMVTAGKDNSEQADVETVAQKTLRTLQKTVLSEVPGIAFLSGGQSPDLATDHLNRMNKYSHAEPDYYPWRLTASYGRALQGEALEAWGGKKENVQKAQEVFLNRAEKVFKASMAQL